MSRTPLIAIVVWASFALTAYPADAARKITTASSVVNGKTYKVIRYDNGTVKVVEGGVFGKAPGLVLREAMRRAVHQTTGCTMTDDFFVDAKLMGTLTCSPMKQGA